MIIDDFVKFLDEISVKNTSEDYWYDVGVDEAQNMLRKFFSPFLEASASLRNNFCSRHRLLRYYSNSWKKIENLPLLDAILYFSIQLYFYL